MQNTQERFSAGHPPLHESRDLSKLPIPRAMGQCPLALHLPCTVPGVILSMLILLALLIVLAMQSSDKATP